VSKQFEQWAVVEVMGHRRFAGFVTEESVGGASFVRVDVPECEAGGEKLPAFCKLLGASSIYAITPCTEETARAYASQFRARAFDLYEAPRLSYKPAAIEHDEPDDYDDGLFCDDGDDDESI